MAEPTKKKRLDTILFESGLAGSRHQAAALIMAGKVMVDGRKVEKPGTQVALDASLRVIEGMPYVSRGGLKLAGALEHFGISPQGLVVLDAGASTGGFTHCLLERGARKVIAVDVGYGQMDWILRNDERVQLMEHTNIRYLEPGLLGDHLDAAVADLSFISLAMVLAKFRELLPKGAWFLPMIKPQFEVGKGEVPKGGVVRDPDKIRRAIQGVKDVALRVGFIVRGETESPIRGPKGNREFFLYLE
jgi:23S rRNA (cytidine1920-2'-O)/16S rRNA (cytidine1409-2'-O)-methyltransferase